MTEQTYPYEALLAFAQTKGPAFDSFMRDWNQQHQPEPKPLIAAVVKPVVEEPTKVQIAIAPTPTPAPTVTTASEWGSSKKTKAKVDAATATSPASTVNTES